MAEEKAIEEIIILGTGPAGLSAALYAARADLKPLVLTGAEIGGQAALTDRIENYPGFPEGVGGNELADLFQKNAERFGARLEYDAATEVDLSQRPFLVKTYSKDYFAKTLILTTGATSNKLNIPGENEFRGRGVSYCATCDGWFFKEKKVAVVGGGDSALEEAIFLTRYATSVTIIHRRDTLRAGAILQDRAKDNPKIHFIWDTVITSIEGTEGVEKVRLKMLRTKKSLKWILMAFLSLSDIALIQNYSKVRSISMTRVMLLWIIACEPRYREFSPREKYATHIYRQVVTSAGMGAAAAIEATRFLENE